jgi:hypothetical protein
MADSLGICEAKEEKANIIDCVLLVWSSVSINETCASCRSAKEAWKPSFILGQPHGTCEEKPVPRRMWRLHEIRGTDLLIFPKTLVVQTLYSKRLMQGGSAKVMVCHIRH